MRNVTKDYITHSLNEVISVDSRSRNGRTQMPPQAASMAVGWQVNDHRRLHHYVSILTLYNENPGEIKSVLERFLRKSPGHFYGSGMVVGVNF